MSLYFTAFIRLGLAVGISTALQSTFAKNVSNFESAFAKVQYDQAQTDIWLLPVLYRCLNSARSQLRFIH